MPLEKLHTNSDNPPDRKDRTDTPYTQPEISGDKQSPPLKTKGKLDDLKTSVENTWNARKLVEIQTLRENLQQITRREGATIKTSEKNRKMGGWFGSFNRWWIGSDPYAIDISNSKQIIASTEDMEEYLVSATNEDDHKKCIALLNIVRRTVGMQEFQEDWSMVDGAVTSTGLNMVDNNTSRYEAEQQAISASRDTIETGLDIASLGAAVVGKTFVKQGIKQTFRNSAAVEAASVIVGNKFTEERVNTKMDRPRGEKPSK